MKPLRSIPHLRLHQHLRLRWRGHTYVLDARSGRKIRDGVGFENVRPRLAYEEESLLHIVLRLDNENEKKY